MILLVVGLTSAAFLLGWVGGQWACSRRTDCPRYASERLERWKTEAAARERRPRRRRLTTPPEGGEAA